MNVFSYRGALPPGSPMFIGRENEIRNILEISKPPLRSYAIIFGGRQIGKTSLIYQLYAKLPTHVQFAQIDLTALRGNDTQQVYSYVAEELIDHLGLVSEMDSKLINDGMSFRRFLRGLKLKSFVVIALDELGGLTATAALSLANTLRSIHQDRFEPGNETFGDFMFILAGGIELYKPVSLSPVSPLYNISEKFYLGDLSREEQDRLLIYGLVQVGTSIEEANQCCATIYELAHGHPYMTQRLGYLVAEHFIREQVVPDAVIIHNIVTRFVTDDEWNIGPMLNHVRLEGLQETLIRIAMHPGELPFFRVDSEIARLELISLIREEHGYCIIRNKIYAQTLSTLLFPHSVQILPLAQQPTFIKLHLTILSRRRLGIHVLESPEGEPRVSSRLPFTSNDLTAVLKALQPLTLDHFTEEQLQALERLKLLFNKGFTPHLLQRVGEYLYKALMVNEVNVAFQIARYQMRVGGKPIVLQLRFNSEDVELARYPWELLFDGHRHLLPSRAAQLTRYIAHPEITSRLSVHLPLHLLYLTSRPADLAPISISNEREKVRQALRELEQAGLLQVVDLQVPNHIELLNYLNTHNVHILHFDGHGVFARRCPYCEDLNYPHQNQCGSCQANLQQINAQGYLAFEDGSQARRVNWVSSVTLEHLLYPNPPSLVVLSACSSATVRGETLFGSLGPSLIRAGVPAVVATQLPISADAATTFCHGLYRALADFQSVPEAVNFGRQLLFAAEEQEWFVPVLYLRSKDDEGYLFIQD